MMMAGAARALDFDIEGRERETSVSSSAYVAGNKGT